MGQTCESFKHLCNETDFFLLANQKREIATLLKDMTLTSESREAIDGVINFLDSLQDLATDHEGIPEFYVFPEEANNIVRWPESQDLMEIKGFDTECTLINDEYGLSMYGSAAYFVPNDFGTKK